MRKIVWSGSLDDFVISGFTYKGHHYTWNEADSVYYRDDVDDVALYEAPVDAVDDRY